MRGKNIARINTGRNTDMKIVIHGIELGFVNEGWFRLTGILARVEIWTRG
jgi:hypothetical protein